MIAVVRFPSDKDIDEMSDDLEREIDNLFDYMDGRVAEGVEAADLLKAMVIIVQMVASNDNMIEAVH